MSDFFAIVQNDDETGNPTLEFKSDERDGSDWAHREITIEEMRSLIHALEVQVMTMETARRQKALWEKRAYRVG